MKLTWLPNGLIIFRLLLAPLMLGLAYAIGKPNIIFVICLWLGLLSDIFDGILARHWGLANETLRRNDSRVDIVFWLSAGWCIWIVQADLILEYAYGVMALFCLEPISNLIYYFRFKCDGCAHNWLSKLWGIFLLLSFSSVLGWAYAGFLFPFCIGLGLLSQLDRILIASWLPQAECDIPSAYHAYLRRQGKSFQRYKLFN